MFGVFWALAIAGLAVGAFVTPFLLHGIGLNGTLYAAAFAVPVLVVLSYPRFAAVDKTASRAGRSNSRHGSACSSRCISSLAAPRAVLERLAAAATESTVAAGSVIISEGAEADALFVLVSGEVEVLAKASCGAVHGTSAFMQSPAYFGEIGLIERIARTATVRAVTDVVLWRIEGETFLSALNESRPSKVLVQAVAGRLAATHPSRTPSPSQPKATQPKATQPKATQPRPRRATGRGPRATGDDGRLGGERGYLAGRAT